MPAIFPQPAFFAEDSSRFLFSVGCVAFLLFDPDKAETDWQPILSINQYLRAHLRVGLGPINGPEYKLVLSQRPPFVYTNSLSLGKKR